MAHTFEEDLVRLKLNGDEVPIAQEYSVSSGVFNVPAAFSMTVGHGGAFAAIATKYGPRTDFELLIRGATFSRGETDSIGMGGSDATVVKLTGRDYAARLIDTQLESTRTFSNVTYESLLVTALEEVGLGDRLVFADNTANRKAITGSSTVTKETPPTEAGVITFDVTGASPELPLGAETAPIVVSHGQPGTTQTRTVYKEAKVEIGNSWWEFLTANNKKAGLFIWSTAKGDFVIVRPNGKQKPLYRILRRANEVASVTGVNYDHSILQRFTECIVYGHVSGGKHGTAPVLGHFIDKEMVEILNPKPEDRKANGGAGKFRKRFMLHEPRVKTPEHAEFVAKRKIAEGRRNGKKLSYTVPGHTTPALSGGGRLVWQPDTVVEVIDDQLGIEGPMYIHEVTFSSEATGKTSTTIHLMYCEDLLFAEDLDDASKMVPKVGVNKRDPNWRINWDMTIDVGDGVRRGEPRGGTPGSGPSLFSAESASRNSNE